VSSATGKQSDGDGAGKQLEVVQRRASGTEERGIGRGVELRARTSVELRARMSRAPVTATVALR
jgi:hypothetical protein